MDQIQVHNVFSPKHNSLNAKQDQMFNSIKQNDIFKTLTTIKKD